VPKNYIANGCVLSDQWRSPIYGNSKIICFVLKSMGTAKPFALFCFMVWKGMVSCIIMLATRKTLEHRVKHDEKH
jgi:hypothetical protein